MGGTLAVVGIQRVKEEKMEKVNPVFGSSFIQSWYCQDWSAQRWQQELTMMKGVGITELIIQTTVDNTPGIKTVSYPSSINGYTSNPVDMLSLVLIAADDLGMKVRLGVCMNEEWWRKGAAHLEWLIREAEANIQFVNEIAQRYAGHTSFGGWYIPYEISNLTATTQKTQTNLNHFLKRITHAMNMKTPGKTVMISPFYNSKQSLRGSLLNWSAALKTIFSGTSIDILALQDSVGVKYNTVSQLGRLFAYTKKGTDAAGMVLYANIETFSLDTRARGVSAPQGRISAQLAAVNKWVQGYVAFSINHYQRKDSANPAKVRGYTDYFNYYRSNP